MNELVDSAGVTRFVNVIERDTCCNRLILHSGIFHIS